jgi:hypothetical protein
MKLPLYCMWLILINLETTEHKNIQCKGRKSKGIQEIIFSKELFDKSVIQYLSTIILYFICSLISTVT